MGTRQVEVVGVRRRKKRSSAGSVAKLPELVAEQAVTLDVGPCML